MKKHMTPKGRKVAISGGILAVVVVAAGLFALQLLNPNVTDEMLNVPRGGTMSVSHPVYEDEQELRAKAEVVVRGVIRDSGSLASGSSSPQTAYKLKVLAVDKGNVAVGSILIVQMLGNTTDEPKVYAEGVPILRESKEYLIFGNLSDNGADIYPLAGSTAVGLKTGEGTFTFPSGTTGGSNLQVKKSQEGAEDL